MTGLTLNKGKCMKFYLYALTSKMHGFITDFVGNRSQEVVVNGKKSECRLVKLGIPQATVGPLHFLIYINDIESQLTSSLSFV